MRFQEGQVIKINKDHKVIGTKLFCGDVHTINKIQEIEPTKVLVELELDNGMGFVWTTIENISEL